MAPHEVPQEDSNGIVDGTKDSPPSVINVLVTGFGPFQDLYPLNPSFEITKLLPSILPGLTPDGHVVHVVGHPSPIRVAYKEVRELVPVLHAEGWGAIDLVLHIGMASGRRYYEIERYAHRDGYVRNKDVDGATLPPDDGLDRFGDCPAVMTTSLAYPALLARWQRYVAERPETAPAFGADCRASDDAGRYMCDYVYFNSLAWFARANGSMEEGKATDRPVLFLHVPAYSDEQMLARGLDVTVSLLHAMADTFMKQQRQRA